MTTLVSRINKRLGPETVPLVAFLLFLVIAFGSATPRFLTTANFGSIAFQLPVLGLLTLAMLVPILSGGLNLAIIFTGKTCPGWTLAWILIEMGGPDAGIGALVLGIVAALLVGAAAGLGMGLVIAYTGAHPILVSLAMMIFLRGLGEFLTRGGDISGFPDTMNFIGHGTLLGIPMPFADLSRCRAALAHHAQAHAAWLFRLHDRLQHSGGRVFGIEHEAHAGADLHDFGSHLRGGGNRDGGPVQLGAGWARGSAAPGDGPGLLPRRSRSVWRIRPGWCPSHSPWSRCRCFRPG